MKIFWKLITPVLGAIIGLVALKRWNLFAYFTFADPEKAYDIGIAVYFAVADTFLEVGKSCILSIWNKARVTVAVMLSGNNIDGDLSVNPTIHFNATDQAEAQLTCKISGKGCRLKNSYIKICPPSFATIQVDGNRPEISVDERGIYTVNLGMLFGDNNIKSDLKYQYRILFIKEYCEGEMTAKIEPVYCDYSGRLNRILVNYKNNFAELCAGR